MGKILVFSIARRTIHEHLLDTSNGKLISLQSDFIRPGTELSGIMQDVVWESSREEKDLLDAGKHSIILLVSFLAKP